MSLKINIFTYCQKKGSRVLVFCCCCRLFCEARYWCTWTIPGLGEAGVGGWQVLLYLGYLDPKKLGDGDLVSGRVLVYGNETLGLISSTQAGAKLRMWSRLAWKATILPCFLSAGRGRGKNMPNPVLFLCLWKWLFSIKV